MFILSSSLFTEWILPFLLIFVIIFAILQKSKILGEGKRQIDALVALAIALLTLVVPAAKAVIINLMPWLSVAVAVILVFLLLYGFVGGKAEDKWVKIVFGILAGIFVIGLVLWATGTWSFVKNLFSGGSGSEIWMNILLLIIIGGAVAAVIATSKSGRSS